MSDFFRFPATPHLIWLGPPQGLRDDKVLVLPELEKLLAGSVQIEEKLDGANVGFSLASDGKILAQNRGQYIDRESGGQFAQLSTWLSVHEHGLRDVLNVSLILFGEWCAARHSISYRRLPDWFSLFDVYDRQEGRFWSVQRRDELASRAGLTSVPSIFCGATSIDDLKNLLSRQVSRYYDGPVEGLIVRRDGAQWCEAKAKIVRADFTQAINEHWKSRRIEWNAVDWT